MNKCMNNCNLSGELVTNINAHTSTHCCYEHDGSEYIMIPVDSVDAVLSHVKEQHGNIMLYHRYEVNNFEIFDVRVIES